ncbi:MAG: hypothetical protein DSZ10_04185 [Sulfurovum sp.]|nr:MAG: hypothetical protein DSZ10_04185 [Sulfurovum sp.]
MLMRMKNRLFSLLQLLVVLIFILFEELIWEGIAKPIYQRIHALRILQTVEQKLKGVNATVILVLFVLLLLTVELFGIYAGILFVSGHFLLGLMLYLSKIPIAAFTFWMFRVTEEKLMQFGWFKWLYGHLMKIIDWLKALPVYQKTMKQIKYLKAEAKEWIRRFKRKYFKGSNPFIERLKRHYRRLKAYLDK